MPHFTAFYLGNQSHSTCEINQFSDTQNDKFKYEVRQQMALQEICESCREDHRQYFILYFVVLPLAYADQRLQVVEQKLMYSLEQQIFLFWNFITQLLTQGASFRGNSMSPKNPYEKSLFGQPFSPKDSLGHFSDAKWLLHRSIWKFFVNLW